MRARWPADAYIEGVLSGNRQALSKAITLVESSLPADQNLAAQVLDGVVAASEKRASIRVGLTGVPGVGKSTFIEALGLSLAGKGHQIAVLAVDPSSNLAKGSLLGDKTRMEELSRQPNVYIRPSPSSGTLGGVTAHTREAVILCEAAGFDIILIETVGVGQSEVAVRSLCDLFMLLILPGAGDELQGMKRGIMEMADLLVLTKVEHTVLQQARIAQAAYKNALHLFPLPPSGQEVPVLLSSAFDQDSVELVWEAIMAWTRQAKDSGWFGKQRRQQLIASFEAQLQARVWQQFQNDQHEKLDLAKAEILEGKTAVGAALRRLLA